MSIGHQFFEAGGIGIVPGLLVFSALLIYAAAAIRSSRKYRKWPLYRIICWSLGILCAAAALTGPLAALAHTDFRMHMGAHLLLGMLAPLFIAFSAPMTLLLRSLSISAARKLSGILKSRPIRFFSHPLTASILNIGGLYLLYMTDLYFLMHHSALLFAFIHLHIFLAGYLFTISIVYLDITPHRYGYVYRSIILILALAGHKMLAKFLYAHPPAGVPKAEAEAGSMLMYYGGDLVDAALIVLLCYQWYKAAAPRLSSKILKETI